MTLILRQSNVHLEPLASFFCHLCSEQFVFCEELVVHYDEHFSPGSCRNCNQGLILINDEYHHLQLHDISCGDAGTQRDSFDEVHIKDLILNTPLEATKVEFLSEANLIQETTQDSTWEDVTIKEEKIEIISIEIQNDKIGGDEGEHSETVQCVETRTKTDCDGSKDEDDFNWEYDTDAEFAIPAEKKRRRKRYKPPPPIIVPEDEANKLPSYLVSELNGEKRLRSFQCDICKRYVLDKRILATHMKEQHIKVKRKSKKCDICGKTFSASNIKRHIRAHMNIRNFVCSFCGKGFKEKGHLNAHLNGHLGLRPHKCTVCDKAFGRLHILAGHMRIHTGEKPYVCKEEGCSRSYAHQSDLKRHLYGQHRIYSKKFQCQICLKVFSEKKLLAKHMLAHP